MESLIEKSARKVSQTSVTLVRKLIQDINWDARLIGIKGSRGVGKTTLLLQYIKLHYAKQLDEVLYVSLDNIWFSEHRLVDLADEFVKRGGKYLFLDEVHKYESWSIELKNIYDDYSELKVVFTGSSLLKILNSRADLSRRAVIYDMQGLSFREYLCIILKQDLPTFSLQEILNNHLVIAQDIVQQIKPLQYFQRYLESGYYPFFQEQPDLYYSRIEEVLNMILEIELPLTRKVEISFVRKIKQLLLIISESAPFIPNVTKIAERIGINRQTLLSYLSYMNDARVIFSIYKNSDGISLLQKPDKIFLENTNLMYALANHISDLGNVRKTFFANQLRSSHQVEFSTNSDFIIDRKYTFEIGGKSKDRHQIKTVSDAFVAADNIEYGFDRKIPLWLFGFLY